VSDILQAVPGLLSEHQVRATSTYLAALQLPSGQIPWFPGGHCDPWNHVEVAMALTSTGHFREAHAAYAWLATTQRADGSWFNYYVGEWVSRRRIDTNVCGYVATGVWHHFLVTGDVDALNSWWPMVSRAIDFVVRCARSDGAIAWSLDERGSLQTGALLTGSSSLVHALHCANQIATLLDLCRPQWLAAEVQLAHVIAHHPDLFMPKEVFAMDWYYPVLAGVHRGERGRRVLEHGWDTFVMDQRGVRCVSTNDWVTAAETAECALALHATGASDRAQELLASTTRHRRDDGSYLTGWVYPQEVTFPGDEVSSYTAAAVLLAGDAVTDSSGGAGIFAKATLEIAACDEIGCAIGS
jgi:hypothetical protein